MTLPPPRDRQTKLHVSQTYTATNSINIDAGRFNEAPGLKLVQISSMFVTGICENGQMECHDSDAVRFIGDDLERQQHNLADITPGTLFFTPTVPLGSSWLDALHTDDQSWQGNTPNVRIALDKLPDNHTISPQGLLSATTSPDDDNVNLWLHDNDLTVQSWLVDQHDQIGYWLLAQDNPPEPWADLGLGNGETFLDFEGSHNCVFDHDAGQATNGSVNLINGYKDTALQLEYDIGQEDGNWTQVRCNFSPPLNLSAYDHVHFDWRGDSDSANSMEIAFVNPGQGQEQIFGRGYHHMTQYDWWGQFVVPFSFLHPWTGATEFDPSQVSAFFISIVKDPVADSGGNGRLTLWTTHVCRGSPSLCQAHWHLLCGLVAIWHQRPSY